VQVPSPQQGVVPAEGRKTESGPHRRKFFITAAIAGAGFVLFLMVLAIRVYFPRAPAENGGPVGATNADSLAGKQLAEKVHQLLKAHCYRCHGENGAAEGGFNYILDLDKLKARKKIIAGNPEKSRLFRRVKQGEMPPEEEKSRPEAKDIALLKQWIEEGAPSLPVSSSPLGFVSTADMVERMHASIMALPERDRPFARFFTFTHLANAGLRNDELQTYRVALGKLVNGLSWNKEIVNPKPIDPGQTILRIDIRDYQWSDRLWKRILEGYPYGILWDHPKAKECVELAGGQLPFLRGDWFVAEASRPPLYHEMLQMPATERELEKQLHIELEVNIRQERVVRAGFNGSGVSRNNRLIERHASPYGSYWRSYDFADNVGQRNLFAFPLGPGLNDKGFLPDGGEIIFSLPNGLHAFMLINENGNRLDKGPLNVVSDSRRPDRAVENGISCMTCHTRGLIPKTDQVRLHVEKNPSSFSPQELETIKALYADGDKLNALFAKDNGRFRAAVEQTGGKFTSTDSLATLVSYFEQELDLASAAAELGFRPVEFSDMLVQSPSLLRILGPLRVSGGTVQRRVFTQSIGPLAEELKLGVLLPHTR